MLLNLVVKIILGRRLLTNLSAELLSMKKSYYAVHFVIEGIFAYALIPTRRYNYVICLLFYLRTRGLVVPKH